MNIYKKILQKIRPVSEIVKSSYNSISEDWNETRKNLHWEEFDFFYSKFPFGKNEKVLDLGCGTGRLFDFLESKGLKSENYFGIDFSEKMIEEAKKNYPENKYFVGNIADENFLDGKIFDQIWCIAMFHHLSSKKERIIAIKNLHKILNKNGKIFLTVWNFFQENNKQKNKFKKILRKSFWRNIFSFGFFSKKDCFFYWRNSNILRYYYAFEKNEIIKLFEKNGFKIKFFDEGKNFSLVLEKK